MASRSTYQAYSGKGGAYAPPTPSVQTKKTPKGLIVLAVLLLILGVGFIAYPYVSDYLNRLEQSRVSHHQQEVVAETPVEDLSAEIAHAEDFNARLLAGRVVVTDPFDPDNVAPTDEEYEAVLNLVGDGVMGEIIIPRIEVDLPIYHGVEGDGMNHGVGHMPSTSLPIGGPSTHAVLAGHTGLPSARIFDALDQIGVGDWFILSILGEDHAYVVTGTEVVLPDETESLHVEEGKDLVTLVTCTPYGVNTHRLLVHAERCEVPAEWLEMQRNDSALPPLVPASVAGTPKFIFTIIGLAVALVILIAILIVLRRRRRGNGGSDGTGAGTGGSGGGPADGTGGSGSIAGNPYGPVDAAPLVPGVIERGAPARDARDISQLPGIFDDEPGQPDAARGLKPLPGDDVLPHAADERGSLWGGAPVDAPSAPAVPAGRFANLPTISSDYEPIAPAAPPAVSPDPPRGFSADMPTQGPSTAPGRGRHFAPKDDAAQQQRPDSGDGSSRRGKHFK